MRDPHVFGANPLDRGERVRRDDTWLGARVRDPASRFLLFWNLNVLLTTDNPVSPAWLPPDRVAGPGITVEPCFLGLRDATAHFAIDVSELDDPITELNLDGLQFEEVRAAGAVLPATDAGIVAQARAQIDWHHRHRFCSVCGSPSNQQRGGQVRKCPDCGAQHFPRTDPVIIVVVSRGDRCILGQSRGRLSRMKMYSALAGFIDQGESIEEAVRREVMEEAGVRVGEVRYHSSQPWPFPSSLMIGCHAEAISTEIQFDEVEMSDVRWVKRADVLLALEGKNPDLNVPAEIAIAHHLIKAWAEGEA
ncbi:MAG: NAD(+) diphosphatase [Chloroflexota bacterium]|nr:NAD(+) diphosphatase [Chloroflexota bacterium]